MDPWMSVLAVLVQAGVCVSAPPQTLNGARVQTVVCNTSGMVPEPAPLAPAGKLPPMRPELRTRG